MYKNRLIVALLLALSLGVTACSNLPTSDNAKTTSIVPFDAQIKNNSLAINKSETLAVASYSDDRGVKVYDLKKKKLIATLDYVTPRNIQFADDGKSFYISDSSLGIVQQVSAQSLDVMHEVKVDKGAFGFAIYKNQMFINNEANSTVTVLNLDNWQIERVITGFANPRQGIKIGPSGRFVYVTNFAGDDVRIIDTDSWQIVKTLDGIPGVRAIAISPDEKVLYGASSKTNSLRVISIKDNQILKVLPTGKDPYGASLSKDGQTLITGNKEDGSVQVFNLVNYQLIKTIYELDEPRQAIIYSKVPGKIYVLQKDLSIAIVNYKAKNETIYVIK